MSLLWELDWYYHGQIQEFSMGVQTLFNKKSGDAWVPTPSQVTCLCQNKGKGCLCLCKNNGVHAGDTPYLPVVITHGGHKFKKVTQQNFANRVYPK